MRRVLYVFGLLTDGDIEWLLQAGRKVVLAAGTRLVEQGKPVDSLYVVLSGQLSVHVEGRERRELRRLGCGEMVGELSFLDSRPPTATVEAVEASSVLAVPRAAIDRKLREDDGFGSRFYHALGVTLAVRLRSATEGYVDGGSLADDANYGDELDPEELDRASLAGVRFDWVLRKLGAA